VAGQERTKVTLGFGIPELINIGFRTQINQSEAGLSLGFFPPEEDSWVISWEKMFSVCGDYYFHFAGKSRFSDLRPFYARAGLNYWKIEWEENDIDNCLSTQIRLGRDFNFSKKTGMSLDAGVLIHLNEVNDAWGYVVGYAAGINLFYKF